MVSAGWKKYIDIFLRGSYSVYNLNAIIICLVFESKYYREKSILTKCGSMKIVEKKIPFLWNIFPIFFFFRLKESNIRG